MAGIEKIAMEFCGRGGKRLRPRLCKAAFEAARSAKGHGSIVHDQGQIESLCEAVECFHKASLIHDDIQDGDEERYGRLTVWKEHGVALAIAAGDWLVAHGYDLIINSGFPNALEMVKATVASHVALCEGQGDDLLAPQTLNQPSPRLRLTSPQPSTLNPQLSTLNPQQPYLSICERKTGEAFALAAELGALAAGVDGVPYRRYGLDFGILFQVRDDLADGDAPEATSELADELAHKLESTTIAKALGSWHC